MDDVVKPVILTQPELIEYILDGGCRYLGLNRSDLEIRTHYSNSRSPVWHKKRYLALILDTYTNSSKVEIASLLGYRTHGNVISHIRKLKEEISNEVYGCDKTKKVYTELMSYLNLKQ